VQGCYVGWSVSCDIKSCVVRVFFYFLLRIKKSYSHSSAVPMAKYALPHPITN
jgi:hypothetical protein